MWRSEINWRGDGSPGAATGYRLTGRMYFAGGGGVGCGARGATM